MRTRIKVCCMMSPAEVRAAVMAGADAVGVVGPMPSGPGPVDDDTARTLIASAPPGVSAFLLTSERDTDGILRHVRATGASVVQIVRHVDPRRHLELRAEAPGLKIVQVVHMETEAAVELGRGYAHTADALLLDSGRPSDPVESLGGTGEVHDWKLSRQIVALVDKPVFLAGGLNEANVGDAIAAVRPFGVDLCSGLRTMGKLDQRKLTGFFGAVRSAG